MTIKLKMMVVLEVDAEEYPIPSDGNIAEEFEDTMQDLLHDVYGVEIKKIKVIQEN
tara:strand:- start:270 stop:437 length:168 start_codon:yes stop_codon:yes gene_type:complete